MAKKLKPEHEDEEFNGSNEPKEFDAGQFRADIDEAMARREDVASANQDHGNTLKTLGQERGYNMQAFKQLLTLKKKSPENAADFLRTFMAGVEALGLGEEDQPDMLSKSGADSANKKRTGKQLRDQLQ